MPTITPFDRGRNGETQCDSRKRGHRGWLWQRKAKFTKCDGESLIEIKPVRRCEGSDPRTRKGAFAGVPCKRSFCWLIMIPYARKSVSLLIQDPLRHRRRHSFIFKIKFLPAPADAEPSPNHAWPSKGKAHKPLEIPMRLRVHERLSMYHLTPAAAISSIPLTLAGAPTTWHTFAAPSVTALLKLLFTASLNSFKISPVSSLAPPSPPHLEHTAPSATLHPFPVPAAASASAALRSVTKFSISLSCSSAQTARSYICCEFPWSSSSLRAASRSLHSASLSARLLRNCSNSPSLSS
mmetsp:Transcript_34578/g.87327  ORF Transcript_34578/g.87327 Transcript_34578/m.87327 type:complete len:295 (+) Transcript_34578:1141-2025(+)